MSVTGQLSKDIRTNIAIVNTFSSALRESIAPLMTLKNEIVRTDLNFADWTGTIQKCFPNIGSLAGEMMTGADKFKVYNDLIQQGETRLKGVNDATLNWSKVVGKAPGVISANVEAMKLWQRTTAAEALEANKLTMNMNSLRISSFQYLVAMFGMQAVSKLYDKTIGTLVTSGEIWKDITGEVNDALGDLADVLAEALYPVIDVLVPIIETIADVFDSLPAPVKTFLAVAIVLGGILLQMVTSVLELIVAFYSLKALMVSLNASTVPLKTSLGSLGISILNVAGNALKLGIAVATSPLVALAKGGTAAGKGIKDAGKALKTSLGPIGSAVAGFGAMALLMLVMSPLLELLEPILDALGDAFSVAFEWLEPIIDWIANWIEENPALATSILLALVAILGFIAVKDTFMGFINGIIGGTNTVATQLPAVNKGLGSMASNILAVAGALAILVLSLGAAIWLLSQTRFTLPELIALIGTLVISLVVLGGTFLAFALIIAAAGVPLAALSPVLIPLAIILLAVGAAAFLVGAGMMLAGMGVQFAANGLLSLVSSIPQLMILVPLMFALMAAFFGLGIAAGIFAITGLISTIALLGIAIGITAIAGAIMLLAVALNMVPDWARGFIGGIASFFGGLFGAIPHLQEGGLVKTGGVAILHPAEVVTPKGGRQTATVYITGPLVSVDTVSSSSDIDKIAEAVDAKLRESYSRRTY